jgi:hypothetical protein
MGDEPTPRLGPVFRQNADLNSDFEEFFGTWSPAEADAFDAAFSAMRRVDPDDRAPDG